MIHGNSFPAQNVLVMFNSVMRPLSLILATVLLPLLYALSLGPVLARVCQMRGSPPHVPAFYRPLIQLSNASPLFRNLLRRYLEWWGLPINKTVPHRRYSH
jgi:hypothetical protein